MVELNKEFIKDVLDVFDEVHEMRFRAPKTSVSWYNVERDTSEYFRMLLHIEKTGENELEEKLPDNTFEGENLVELDEEQLYSIVQSMEELENIAHDDRKVVDGDDVRKVIERIENVTGVTKEEYREYRFVV